MVLPLDRLVRKEVALGVIRELQPPQSHIGLGTFAPFQDVESDDVIFEYVKGAQDGLVPARAEDAEAELAMKDDFTGEGRASLIDWAIKDRYKPSDVTRFRENLIVADRLGGVDIPRGVTSMVEQFNARLARDEARRRRKIDNRLEQLIMTSLDEGVLAYNDGKIKFSVDWGRPVDQHDEAPTHGTWIAANAAAMNPVDDMIQMQNFMYDRYSVNMMRAWASRKALQRMWLSDKFQLRGPVIGDPNYTVAGWGPAGAVQWVETQTGIVFTEYDAVYRTRALGSTTTTNVRFLREDRILFLPSAGDIDEIDDALGFGKTLTAPHPEGNWSPGFYEWERTEIDPWGTERGVGIKAFPVFPHMDLTYTMKVF